MGGRPRQPGSSSPPPSFLSLSPQCLRLGEHPSFPRCFQPGCLGDQPFCVLGDPAQGPGLRARQVGTEGGLPPPTSGEERALLFKPFFVFTQNTELASVDPGLMHKARPLPQGSRYPVQTRWTVGGLTFFSVLGGR